MKPSPNVTNGRRRFKPKEIVDDPLRDLHKRLEFFPTPPWAVRAVINLLPEIFSGKVTVYDPCAGEAHLIEATRSMGMTATGSDIHDYGVGLPVSDALDFMAPTSMDESVLFTNPPFSGQDYSSKKPTATELIIQQGLLSCRHVVVIGRLGFLACERRYDLHYRNPRGNLKTFLPFSERVPMILGHYDPKASTATDYCAFHYQAGFTGIYTPLPIPPGQRAIFERPEDMNLVRPYRYATA